MSEKAIYNLLSTNTALKAVVPQARMFAGLIPLETALPAIAYNFISGTQQTAIGLTEIKQRSRIQITVAASTYPVVKQVIELVVDACNLQQGTFNGVITDSVIKDLVGPDFRDDEAGIYYQTVDFIVTHNA